MKKQNLLTRMLLLCALVVGSNYGWAAADVTITFNSSSKVNSDGTINQSPYDDGNITLTAAQNGSGSFPAFSSSQLRLYGVSGGNGCSVTITSAAKWIHTVVFTFSANTYAAASQGKYTYTSGTTGTWSGGEHNAKTVTLQNTNDGTTQVRITKIEITYGDAPAVVNPAFSAPSGYIVKGSAVEITSETAGADIYYTTNGTNPSSASTPYTGAITVNNDVTIKAIAIKGSDESEIVEAEYEVYTPVPGLSIDFEQSNTIAYSDWSFVNVGIHSSGITAHGGSAWGSNVNAADNGVSTCSITTKNKVAHPGTFTCYISKESDNTGTSSWIIQTSSDGSEWTNVATKSATGMSKGEWQEFTADLSTYTNVYVRLSYGSNTAKRAVDDIVLTEAVTLNAKGYATYSSAHDFTFSGEGVKAYKMALDEGEKTITGTEVTGKIKAGEGILFKGSTSGTVTITSTSGATALDGNNLKGSTKADGTTADKPTYCYVLSGDTFVSYSGATLAANKAYFEASSDLADARPFTITFEDGGATGIAGVEAKKFVEDNKFYNLNGQQVAQPTKGLYIVNGKKVVLK